MKNFSMFMFLLFVGTVFFISPESVAGANALCDPTLTNCVKVCLQDACRGPDGKPQPGTRCLNEHAAECDHCCHGGHKSTEEEPSDSAAPMGNGEWYCFGYIGPCSCPGDDITHQCANAYGRGMSKRVAQIKAWKECQDTLTRTAGAGVCTCNEKADYRLRCEQDK